MFMVYLPLLLPPAAPRGLEVEGHLQGKEGPFFVIFGGAGGI
jgi:hypothetical protein